MTPCAASIAGAIRRMLQPPCKPRPHLPPVGLLLALAALSAIPAQAQGDRGGWGCPIVVESTTEDYEEVFTTTDTSDFLGSVRCTAPRGCSLALAVEVDAATASSLRCR